MKSSTFHRFVLIALFTTLSALFVSSCNTVRGVGRDVQRLGNKVERAAR